MPDMFDNLRRMSRLKNLFDPGQLGSQPSMPSPQMPDTFQAPNLGNRQGMGPFQMNFDPSQAAIPQQQEDPFEHQALDRINQMMGAFPERKDPSVLRRIGSMVMGVGYGPDAQQKFLNRPNDEAMKKWTDEWTPTMQAANLERYGNTNTRILLRDKELQDKNDKTQELANRKQDETERSNREKESVSRIRASAYDHKNRNPNSVFKSDKEGYLIALDPQTNQLQYITDDQGNKVKSSVLSDTDRINLQFDRREQLAEVTGEEARKTRAIAPGGAEKADSPQQRKIAEYLKAREALNTHPEWAEFIKLGDPSTNDFTIAPPTPGRWFNKGTPPDVYETIKKSIYGDVTAARGPAMTGSHTPTGATPQSLPKPAPKAPTGPPPAGEKQIFRPDGTYVGNTRDDPTEIAKFTAKGYVVK